MRKSERNTKIKASKPERKTGQSLILILIVAVTAALIVWVYSLGKKAENTVSVAMLADSVYKNQVITDTTFKPYEMLAGEFEKYAINEDDGSKTRRIVMYEETPELYGAFAAYPLQSNTIAMWSNFVKSRIDNSDTLLYSYPGKFIIPLGLDTSELQAFKTFLQPGDRVTITAVYSTSEKSYVLDEKGEIQEEETEVYRQETVFNDIMLADILNGEGKSILDLYTNYNELTVYEQAMYDADESWQEQTEPSSLIIALTPEEMARYYQFSARSNVEFHMALPQRTS